MLDFYNLKNLPLITNHRHAMQVSSFDRKEQNADYEQFLYQDADGSMVLFDEKGRGCIKSIWCAVTHEDTVLKFYFDGEAEPRYTSSLFGFFNGELPEFDLPANTFLERGHWDLADCRCGNCFVPIPYEKGLKITASGNTNFYYHIMYERFDCDVPKELAFPCDEPFYEKVFPNEKVERLPVTHEIEAEFSNEYNTIYNHEGSGVITELTVEADRDADLSAIMLDFFFDDAPMANIACPLGHFFAMPLGFTEVHTLAVDTRIEGDKQVMSFYMPIPYWKHADLCFVNPKRDGVKIKLKLRVEENNYDENSTGLLHGDYREGLTELYEDWKLAEFSGRGSVVGIVQTCHGGQWCEGNEHFYINGTVTPQINGTGTEDLYLGCYWPNLKFDSPVAGCVNDIYIMGGNNLKGAFEHAAGYYRYFHDMPLSYENGIKMTIQHGAVGQTFSDYTSLVLSYRRDEASLELTDIINVSSAASRALHAYEANGEEFQLRGKVEADRKAPIFDRVGYKHTESIEFKVAAKKGNSGVVLRRLYDQSVSPQSAKVYANGEYIGVWHNPNFNDFAPYADSDFYLPKSVVGDTDVVEIRLEPLGTFTDFEYKIYTAK